MLKRRGFISQKLCIKISIQVTIHLTFATKDQHRMTVILFALFRYQIVDNHAIRYWLPSSASSGSRDRAALTTFSQIRDINFAHQHE